MRFTVRVPRQLREMVKQANWKKISAISAGSVVGVLLLVQIFYPTDRLLPFSTIDGQNVSNKTKVEATAQLDEAYKNYTIAVYMGTGKEPVLKPKLATIDIAVNNSERISGITYPWYLRIVPSSLFWAKTGKVGEPKVVFGKNFTPYVEKNLMPSCKQAPIDATLKADGDTLVPVPSVTGGTCEQDDVIASIKKISPILTRGTDVKVARKEQAPAVTDKMAASFAKLLNERLKSGITLDVLGTLTQVAAKDVLSWLDFSSKDNDIVANVSVERAGDWLNKNIAATVAIAPGVSQVTTLDFTELSRVNGASGRALNVAATVASIQEVVGGTATQASSVTAVVPPTEQYTRTYSASDKGLTALLENYAKDHPGTFGISLVELDGKKRRASYNGDKQFVTASTYKLFVAYSLLKQIDAGKRDWSSNEDCFNKMISLSNNACAESFLNSLGLTNVTKDIQAVGLKNSNFTKEGGPYTTANDLSLMLGMIATSQNFSSVNQQRLISAMKANVYRKGIPAGVSGTVANKVGFMDGLLHDAAIVYGLNGTYVLAIMTDGSSWATIADLAKQIDTLHAK